MLASLDDVNTFLPRDKFSVTDGNEEVLLTQTDVERLIKGYLSSTFTAALLATWADPDSTPGYIRACAGRLVAAFYYSKKVSEDLPDWDKTYPQRLYNEAMAMLEAVRSGQVVLDGTTETSGTEFGLGFFWPNGTEGEPKFTMDMVW